MKEHLSDMRLDWEVISREHQLTKGLGTAHLRAAHEIKDPLRHFDHLAFSATNFRRAAADALLLNDFESAQSLFVRAGEVYSTMRMPYAFCMFALAGDIKGARIFWNSIVEQEQASEERHQTYINKQHVYTLLYAAEIPPWRNAKFPRNLPERIRSELESARPVPIGVLGLPVGAYLNLSNALLEGERNSIEEALLPFVASYNSAMLQAGASIHHWRRMALPFHPAEPDFLAVVVLSHLALRHRERSLIEILGRMPVSWQASTVIKEFLQMRFREDETERHR